MAQVINESSVTAIFARHLRLYRSRPASYQTVMLRELAALWEGHRTVLDVGGGTGVVGQAIQDLFECRVTAVDVVDRFSAGLSINHLTFDGEHLPFADGVFDAVTLNNVLHHVPLSARAPLMREVRRVSAGPVYIKDHLASSLLDHLRLTILDCMGNLPFSGMVQANYLSPGDWTELCQTAGYHPEQTRRADYRTGVFGALFPNRLEVAMKWRPVTHPSA